MSTTLEKLTIEQLQHCIDKLLEAPPLFSFTQSQGPLLVQYRFPRSKKKRIRKKWSKRLENYRHFDQTPIRFPHINRNYTYETQHTTPLHITTQDARLSFTWADCRNLER